MIEYGTIFMKKILVVDDNKSLLDVLTMLLRENNFIVSVAMDPVQATMQLRKNAPDLIILDIMMPAGGGMSFYNIVKQSNDTQSIPVIFLTAAPIQELQGKIASLDKRLFINKPWNNEELLSTIRAFIPD